MQAKVCYNKSMRLNKFLATCGVASRRKCDEIIASGKVSINGKVVSELGLVINEKKDKVEYEGKILSLPKDFVYIKLNKPKGFMCTQSDDRQRKTIFDLVKIPNVRLFNVGRLDYDTEGLILLTNDGDFAEKLIHPSFEIEKEYYCTIEGEIKESELAVLRKGVVINGERLPGARVKVLSVGEEPSSKRHKDGKTRKRTKLSVIITQGLNRQIRRSFEAIGKDIILLKRVRIGDIKLGGLSRGQFKELTEKEKLCINSYII